MSADAQNVRFGFGRNWRRFVERNFNAERLESARKRLTAFVGRPSFEGLTFLDLGCGSGLHSYAAHTLGASRVHGFDFDPDSVEATKALQRHAGNPTTWSVERGDVLDDAYIAKLGQWSFVYSWGVLHHTGDMWRAIRNAQRLVAKDGYFYLALYSADADFQPSKEFWLKTKQEYNQAGPLKKRYMVYWYVWRFGMQRELKRLPQVLKQIVTYRVKRGMNYFADVRDWLGGWPMEYAADQDVVDLLEGEFDFRLVNVTTGEACSEFLFERSGPPQQHTNVKAFVAAKKICEPSR